MACQEQAVFRPSSASEDKVIKFGFIQFFFCSHYCTSVTASIAKFIANEKVLLPQFLVSCDSIFASESAVNNN